MCVCVRAGANFVVMFFRDETQELRLMIDECTRGGGKSEEEASKTRGMNIYFIDNFFLDIEKTDLTKYETFQRLVIVGFSLEPI